MNSYSFGPEKIFTFKYDMENFIKALSHTFRLIAPQLLNVFDKLGFIWFTSEVFCVGYFVIGFINFG